MEGYVKVLTGIAEDLYLVGDGNIDSSSAGVLLELQSNEPHGHLL